MRRIIPLAVVLLIGVDASASEITKTLTRPDQEMPSAIEDLNRKVAKGGKAVDWRDLGIAQCRSGRYQDAIKSFGKAESLSDDFYLASYYGLALQETGQANEAAAWYRRAAAHDTKLAADLNARAGLVKAQTIVASVDAEQGFGADERCVAVMPAVDLGGNAADHQAAIGTALAAALASHPDVRVLWPHDVEAWLAGDGRAASDLEDPGRKDRVARTMARRGVDQILTTSFLITDNGETHLRLVLFAATDEGLGEAQSLTSEVGAAGAEIAGAGPALAEVWSAVGAATGPDASSALVPSLAGANACQQALDALRAGHFAVAQAQMCEAAAQSPQVGSVGEWCSVLNQSLVGGDAETLARASDPSALTESIRAVASAERKRERRFDDF